MSSRSRFLLVFATIWTIFFVYTLRATRGVNPLYPLIHPEPESLHVGSGPVPKGKISGQICWEGEIPIAPPFAVPNVPLMPRNLPAQENPHLPKVKRNRLENAVVWLEGVDPAQNKAWDHPTIRIGSVGHEIVCLSDSGERFRVGLIPVGSTVELFSQDNELASIRGRGAETFTVMLPKNHQPVRRTFRKVGWVELSSASGFYWARSWLLVLNHPYATRSRSDGTFTLDGIPRGTYRLNVWHPNWRIVRIDKDPETGVPVRVEYAPPLHLTKTICVDENQPEVSVSFSISSGDFPEAKADGWSRLPPREK